MTWEIEVKRVYPPTGEPQAEAAATGLSLDRYVLHEAAVKKTLRPGMQVWHWIIHCCEKTFGMVEHERCRGNMI